MDDLVRKMRECDDDAELTDPFKLVETRVENLKTPIIARCGQRPERIKDPKKGKLSKWKRYPSENSTEGAECPWRCYAKQMTTKNSFQVFFPLKIMHTVLGDLKFGNFSLIQLDKYKCILSPSQCRRAKRWALNEGENTMVDHYGYIRGPRLGRLGAWFGIDGNESDSTKNTQEETMHDYEIQESQTGQTAPTQSSQTAASDGIAVDNQVLPVNELYHQRTSNQDQCKDLFVIQGQEK
ncbi:hypothetical protein Tco_0500240 [Tanacetum coccineum]